MTMMTLVEMVIAISMMTMMTTFQQLSFASKPVKVYTIFGIPQKQPFIYQEHTIKRYYSLNNQGVSFSIHLFIRQLVRYSYIDSKLF